MTEAPVIELAEAGLTYPGPPPVAALRPTDLRVDRGDYVTVVGPSGSGKSTFLNVVGLLDRATTGTYRLDGIETTDLDQGRRTVLRGRRIGFVFQAYHLLPHRTVRENVELSLLYQGIDRKQRRDRADAALLQVGLGHRLDAVAARLSGGEKQRVAIARAVAPEPSLLLCDEPTGNLDTVTADAVLALIDRLHAAGMTVLVITHDPGVAARGERRLRIVDGRLTEEIA